MLALVALSFLRSAQLATYHDSAIPAHDAFVFQISRPPTQGPKSWIVKADVLALRAENKWSSVHHSSLLYIPLNSVSLSEGQVFHGYGNLKPIRPPLLPYAFDWRKYYTSLGIFSSTYMPIQNLVLIRNNKIANPIYLRLRDDAKYYLHQALPVGIHRNVADAMFLGIGNSIDFETRQSYAALGAIHILSVSGMHVGLLYLGLSFLLGFLLRFRRWGPWVFFCLIMSILWTYAAMTGFSAPVMRSVWMFSVMLFAQVFACIPIH
jgi:competence protein ComEC